MQVFRPVCRVCSWQKMESEEKQKASRSKPTRTFRFLYFIFWQSWLWIYYFLCILPWFLVHLIGNADPSLHACRLSQRDRKHVGTSWTPFLRPVSTLHSNCMCGSHSHAKAARWRVDDKGVLKTIGRWSIGSWAHILADSHALHSTVDLSHAL